MSIVASDQIGRFPDASAPEAVQRLPGVAVARDQGEGRYIQIRGGSAANTQVSFNGIQIPSPEGEARQIALDAVPVDILESIEVSKALLPSMDADAIGGAVNLVTRRAPVNRIFTAEATGGWATLREEAASSGALTFGNRYLDDRLGLLFSGSYSRRDFGSDDIEPSYDLGEPGAADDQLGELQVRHYSLWRSRSGATAALDYRLGEASSLVLTGIYSELVDHEQRRNLLHLIGDNELQFRHKNRREQLRTRSISLAGEHAIGVVRLDHLLAHTRSSEHTPFDTEIRFLQPDITFSPSLSDGDRIQANPAAGAIDGPFEFDRVEPASSDTRDSDLVGALNFTLPYTLGRGASGALRFGAKLRDKDKNQDVREADYRLRDGEAAIVLGQGVGSPFGNSVRHPATYPLPPVLTTPSDVRGFTDLYGARLSGEPIAEAGVNDYDLSERVAAVYAMTEINLSQRLMLLPGVRYEHTRLRADGFAFDADTETLTPTAGRNSYGNLFPMVHARYALGDRTNLRAAFTTTIARPNFYDLVPYRLRDDEDLEIGNPDLEPTTARSFDLLFEHYDRRIGVISAGAFYKRIQRLPGGRVARLQGQADHLFNLALSYERGPFSGQVSYNYHAGLVDEYDGGSADDLEDVFADTHGQLDASTSLRVRRGSTIFLELVNLTNEPFRAYQGLRQRPVQLEFYERWARLGLRVSL